MTANTQIVPTTIFKSRYNLTTLYKKQTIKAKNKTRESGGTNMLRFYYHVWGKNDLCLCKDKFCHPLSISFLQRDIIELQEIDSQDFSENNPNFYQFLNIIA